MAEWDPANLDATLDAFLKANRDESSSRGYIGAGEGPSWATGQEDQQISMQASCQYQSSGET